MSVKLTSFQWDKQDQAVSFIETQEVISGVQCDVYTFTDDKNKDLGIIRIEAGHKTPLQKVLKGDKTIEGYLSGKGKLVITKATGEEKTYPVDENTKKPFEVKVRIGELMQWHADNNSELMFYEICFPPYEDGRYENL